MYNEDYKIIKFDDDIIGKTFISRNNGKFTVIGATNILKGLERQKLIMREPMPEDARLKKIVLLESGVVCHKQAYRNMIHMEETLAAGFSEEDLETLRNMLDHIIANLEGLQEIRCEKM